MREYLLIALATPLLAACATASAQSPYPNRSSAETFECRTTALEQFYGKPPSAELATTILRASGAKTLRWVAHGTAVTMEFRSDRVTVALDAQNRIERISCG